MKAEYLIKRDILTSIIEYAEDFTLPEVYTEQSIDKAWQDADDKDLTWDAMSKFRGSYDQTTDIKCEQSRHCESKSVAKKLKDGTWVGWTYWYGGGKHVEPEAIDWMEYAYILDVQERQEMITLRAFTKA